jgi:hypothetical protein
MPERTNLKEKRFVLAHGFSPWLFGPVALGFVARLYIHHGESAW